jgi:hypothetical protein
MSIRVELNKDNPNRLGDALRSFAFGDVINMLIKALTVTESAISVTTNVATLANQPSANGLLRALATAETGTVHEKLIRVGPITGPQKVTPAPNECVWDGGKKVLFNTVDAVTAASFTYPTDADTTAGVLQREIGQSP